MIKKINLFVLLIIAILVLNVSVATKEKGLGFWTLEQNESTMGLQKSTDVRELLEGDKINVNFTAKYNNLSQIAIWFDVNNRINKDKLIFRLKEINEDKWYFQKDFDTDELVGGEPYLINFPKISNSESQSYRFEIESTSGYPGNAVYVSNLRSYPAIRYHYSLNNFKDNKAGFFIYVTQKLSYIFHDEIISDTLFSIAIAAVFLLLLKLFNSLYATLFFLSFTTLFSLLHLPAYPNPVFILTQILLWGVVNIGLRVTSTVTAFISLVLLLASVILHLLGIKTYPENFASWSAIFIACSAFVQNAQINNRPNIESKQFWVLVTTYIKMGIRFIYEGSFLVTDGSKKKHGLYAVFASDDFSLTQKKELLGHISSESYRAIAKMVIYTPYIIQYSLLFSLIYSLFLNIIQIDKVLNLYIEHFPNDQLKLFILNTGIFLAIWYVIAIAVFYFGLKFALRGRKKYPNFRLKLLLLCVVLYFLRFGGRTINDVTTRSFRDTLLVWSVSPSKTSEAWVDVTVRGVNFKDLPFQGNLYVNNIPQRIIKWTNKEIVFRTNPIETKSGSVMLETLDGKKSNLIDFVYFFK